MGKANSRLTPEQVTDLQKETHFDRKEILQWYSFTIIIIIIIVIIQLKIIKWQRLW